VEVGAIIVATGAQKYEKIGEYLYGVDPDVVTQLELEELLYYGKVKAENVVMILCVGSREKGAKEYCSRICCTEAVMHALKLKEEGKEVYILYRDIRTYGFAEEYYRRAREAGIVFCRYHEDKKPLVERKDGRLSVTFFDPMLQRYIMLPADLVVLNVGMVPYKNEELAKMLKVPLTPDGFFLEAHVKLRPVEFATEGIYLCGFAHSPKFPSETVTQSYAAASRALTLLLKDAIEGEAKIATVKTQICKGCHTCEKVCAYGAVEVLWEEREKAYKAKVNEALCKGCGACAASCPANAVDVAGFSNTQIFSQINALIS
jgi:heterodisulfide reductase subunit A-like polyferredoxin